MNARAQQLVQTEIALTYPVDMSAIVTRASDLSTMIEHVKVQLKPFIVTNQILYYTPSSFAINIFLLAL